MFETKIVRVLCVAVLLSVAWIPMDAAATAPPDLPLPACTDSGGACPATSEDVTGQASGKLGAGGTITITTIPTHSVCVSSSGYPPYDWSPSPCYSAVASPAVSGCAVIDIQDGGETFRELPCSQALYRNSQDMPTPLLTMTGPDGAAGCGAAGDFYTYIFGGPANVAGARWSEFGPPELECKVKFNGTRPDGLYGPTWVKMRVGIDQAQNGDVRHGNGRYAEIYVPVDGDLRNDFVDVSVLASSVLEGTDDHQTVTFTATLTNDGEKDAENVEVAFQLPEQLHFQHASDGRCEQAGAHPFVGGRVVCSGLTVAGKGDALGGDVTIIDVVVRITDVTDFEDEVTISAKVPDDLDASDNEGITKVQTNLRSGTMDDTRQAMQALAPYFDYKAGSELLNQQCNVYMDDIFARLNAIRSQAPEVFANLSYGKITSGDYYWAPLENSITRAGHVGVVVYLKGTDYHQTGIVIHGTPTWSPSDRDSQTRLGTMEAGEHTTFNVFREGTADHGMYYRTPIDHFPGSPTPELPLGCGFEGLYSNNRDEFEGTVVDSCTVASPKGPFYPDAVVVTTESPVDILASNAKGQRVETKDGKIFVQELDSGIHSFATPHEDGTYGWTLVLPRDDYDIQLLGTGEGPYKLTLTTFDENGERVDEVSEGTTQPGQMDEYELAGAPPAPTPDPGNGSGSGSSGGATRTSGSGGGSFGVFTLLALIPLLRRGMRKS